MILHFYSRVVEVASDNDITVGVVSLKNCDLFVECVQGVCYKFQVFVIFCWVEVYCNQESRIYKGESTSHGR